MNEIIDAIRENDISKFLELTNQDKSILSLWDGKEDKLPPLAYAVLLGKTSAETVKALIDAGADVNFQGYNGFAALHYAAEGGNIEKLKLLIEGGANVNVQSSNGDTPIHRAIVNGHIDTISSLRKYGANLAIANNAHQTPHELAKILAIKYSEVANAVVEKLH